MDRRQLEYFLTVAHHGSVTRAAERLHITQPTLSVAIRGLEKEIGGALFERRPNGLVLTIAGRALVDPARRAVREFEVALDTTRAALGVGGGHIIVGAVPAVTAGWLTGVLVGFRCAHPAVAVKVFDDADDRRIVAGVLSGRFDFGLVVSDVADPGVVATRVGSQRMVALLPPNTTDGGKPVSVEELADMELITMHREKSSSRRWFEKTLGEQSIQPKIHIEMDSVTAILPLVLSGTGYALWWTPMTSSMIGRCVIRPIANGLTRPIYVVSRKGAHSPSIEAFAKIAAMREPVDSETPLTHGERSGR
ncbi:LysR family transcriptional regulator [Rhodococcus sp. Eu-32]|uniref:LysR family transcriptional regulator n=1 Tax=Rhodococcus sp. Eu-32 TaxID=1017319 RepID=UPI0014036891|nr:LysR family transcriptional regulator [Rhodococcus sp. Eu-32]